MTEPLLPLAQEIKLQRDSCEACIARIGQTNARGEKMFCSQAHAYELSNLRKSAWQEQRKKDVFKMVYDWGRNGVVVDDAAPAYREAIDEIENTYY